MLLVQPQVGDNEMNDKTDQHIESTKSCNLADELLAFLETKKMQKFLKRRRISNIIFGALEIICLYSVVAMLAIIVFGMLL